MIYIVILYMHPQNHMKCPFDIFEHMESICMSTFSRSQVCQNTLNEMWIFISYIVQGRYLFLNDFTVLCNKLDNNW